MRVLCLAVCWLTAVLVLPSAAAGAPGERSERLRVAQAAHARHVPALMAIQGVVGTGTGLGADGEPEIHVFTAEPGTAGIPARLDGLPVRTHVSGRFHARVGPTCDVSGDGVCQEYERWPRPVPIGISIGHPAITAGTVGARVTDGVQVFALSNNHVLANSNLATLGDAALQPGPIDGGSEAQSDTLGTLADFEPILWCQISFPFYFCPQVNYYDAAVALTTPAELGFATPLGEFGSVTGYGVPNVVIHPAFGDPSVLGDENHVALLGTGVRKHGRTTRDTVGTVATIGATVDVCYDELCTLIARFDEQIMIPGAFSDGGDSGSLVVSDDGFRHPVALLFAGSDTETIVSPIERVLLRFGVGIDDGGAAVPLADAAVTELDVPSWVVVDETTTVSVTVRNVGTEPLAGFDVTLDDETEVTSETLPAPALVPGQTAQLDFSWTPSQLGPHTLTATAELSDDDPTNDALGAVPDVLAEAPGVSLRLWEGTARTDAWTLVDLGVDYQDEMVPICTPLYTQGGLGPLVARVRNAAGTSFEVGLGRPWFGALPGEETSATVHCAVFRAGVYDTALFRMEAVRLDGFAGKDDSTAGWVGQSVPYAQGYVQPVVVGQVVSGSGGGLPGELGVWSTFWARGATSFDPPDASTLFVGRHTAEDPTLRGAETLAWVVVEAGNGNADGQRFIAGLGGESVRGIEDAPPYVYATGSFLTATTHALVASAGMDGIEGGWPILYGASTADAVQPGLLQVAIEEDWWWDPERSHTTEQLGWLVFGVRARGGCGLGFELVLLAPLLGRLARARSSRRRFLPMRFLV